MKDYRTTFVICVGGGGGARNWAGPAWLSFVRPNGSMVHAYGNLGGPCGGGLAVNGVRWLTDDDAVWNQILSLAR